MYSVSVPVKVGCVRGGVADEGGLSKGDYCSLKESHTVKPWRAYCGLRHTPLGLATQAVVALGKGFPISASAPQSNVKPAPFTTCTLYNLHTVSPIYTLIGCKEAQHFYSIIVRNRAAKINQLIIPTYCLKTLIFYHTKIMRHPKTIIIIVIITMIRI